MFGGEVNKTTNGDVCTQASGDTCGKGTEGPGPSHLAGTVGNYIAYSPTEEAIVVGDKDRIQVFELDGTFKEEIPFEGPLASFAGKSVNALDVDEDGNIYFSLVDSEDVFKLSPAGVPLAPGKPGESKFEVGNPLGVAVDVEDNVYAIDDPPGVLPALEARVTKFDTAGNKLVATKAEEEESEFFPYIPFAGPALTGLGTNICAESEEPGNLYVAFFSFGSVSKVNAYGTPPTGCETPPPNPPEVTAQYATSVGREEASVRAEINPRFWQDATFFIEYGTGECSKGKCEFREPVSSELPLTGKSINAAVNSEPVLLDGLTPGTTYHFRFIAKSSGGGPTVGEEGIFTTFAAAGPQQICPANESLRLGPSTQLPDCRAYEMVSPVDKGNADVALWLGKSGLIPRLFEQEQSSTSGESFTYSSSTAFGEPEGAAFVSQYLAERTGGGWESQALSPPHTSSPVSATVLLGSEFQGFSADLCAAWMRHYSMALLAEGAIVEYPNIYRRENCSEAPSYEAVTTAKPIALPAEKYFELRTQGFSGNGSHTIFTANGRLIEDASPTVKENELLLYEHTPEGLRFVCYLPNGSPSPQACAAGTVGGTGGNKSSAHNAISVDGRRIFWSAYSGNLLGDSIPGQIYVRIDGAETRKVSGSKATDPAWYWTASDDGSKVIFAFASGPLKDQLYEFDVDSQTASLIAKEVEGPLGASEDVSRIYFASKEDLDEGGPASADEHNLYLYEAEEGGGKGSFRFVMELDSEDIGGADDQPAPIDDVPAERTARVSPDGLHVTFVSSVSPTPTGYDNHDAETGEPVQEVYLYDATTPKLVCVSCDRSGARPAGENIGRPGSPFWVAARIQGWEALLHAPHVLSEDGHRVFFESFGPLVPRDLNGTWDVYQWEEAGTGTCTSSDSTFSSDSGGCVDLISSGESAAVSTFLDADPSGNNVFFGTQSSLVPPDYGLNDVYVARVGGGFAYPVPEPECEGEACQSPAGPPQAVTPSSTTFHGKGNAKPTKRCRKGTRKIKRKGKVRCVRKAKHGKGERKAARKQKQRRAAR